MKEKIEVLNKSFFKKTLRRIEKDAHKGSNGTLNIIAGSMDYRGAASLCVGSSLRTGVGIVRLLSVGKVIDSVSVNHVTAIFKKLPEDDSGHINLEDLKDYLDLLKKGNAILIGCGLGITDNLRKLILNVSEIKIPKVYDADALNIISLMSNQELNNLDFSNSIFTPHIGEAAKLLNEDINLIKSNPMYYCEQITNKYKCVTVLKDNIIYIYSPDGQKCISKLGVCGLSKGGSGDVLAGLIAGFLTQKYSLYESAKLGVTVHGLASRKCSHQFGNRSMLPSDLEIYISKLLKKD